METYIFQRDSKGRFLKGITSHNKGKGMSPEEKHLKRIETLKKYNNSPQRKEKVRLYHLQHQERVNEIKYKYACSDKGRLARQQNSHRRIARVKQLKQCIDWKYWNWLCKHLNYTCLGCGKQCDTKTITLDHQLPINRGGDNDSWNLLPLCKSCNCRKQDRLFFVDNPTIDLAYGEWLLLQKHLRENI